MGGGSSYSTRASGVDLGELEDFTKDNKGSNYAGTVDAMKKYYGKIDSQQIFYQDDQDGDKGGTGYRVNVAGGAQNVDQMVADYNAWKATHDSQQTLWQNYSRLSQDQSGREGLNAMASAEGGKTIGAMGLDQLGNPAARRMIGTGG